MIGYELVGPRDLWPQVLERLIALRPYLAVAALLAIGYAIVWRVRRGRGRPTVEGNALSKPERPARSPIPFAFFAAIAGMTSCREAWNYANAHTPPMQRYPMTLVPLLAPFLAGGIVTAIVYRMLQRIPTTDASAIPWSALDTPLADDRLRPLSHHRNAPGSAAMSVFLIIMGISALIGVLGFAALSRVGDGAPHATLGEIMSSIFETIFAGALFGAGFGFLIAGPAAVIVWFMDHKDG
jgi:hypothetical protein